MSRTSSPEIASASARFGVKSDAWGKQLIANRVDGVVSGQKPSMLAHDDRIHHQGKTEVRRRAGHGFDNGAVAKRPRLGRVRRDVVQHRAELMHHQNRRQEFHVFQCHSILHRKQRKHRFAIDAQLMKRFEVGLNSRAARGIGTGYG